ncbi:MAG: DNA (cytosine-5-)-methyltransferase [Acidobacteria bacterium]|nr:DNA (cytosine-5-)-methyltransferase [Acidobacteriota bacterium]
MGGFDLGLERAGMSVVWQSEIDPYAAAVLRKHWPSVPNLGDIRSIRGDAVESVDVLCGGFPCQPHSVAGKRKGAKDERHLWPEFARLVRELRPRWVLAENVAGIRATAADEVISDLEAAGYTVWPLVVGLYAFGAPHERMRVCFVAYDNSDRRERPDLHLRPRRQDEAAAQLVRPDGHADSSRLAQWQGERSNTCAEFSPAERTDWGRSEPPVVRRLYGLPSRLDRARRRERIKCLGNSFSPIQAEAIGREIVTMEQSIGSWRGEDCGIAVVPESYRPAPVARLEVMR